MQEIIVGPPMQEIIVGPPMQDIIEFVDEVEMQDDAQD